MIESIAIQKFRALPKLELSGLTRLVLIGGKNNCGKTSLLESLALACNPFTSETYANLFHDVRFIGMPFPWKIFFYNGETQNPIAITVKISDINHRVVINYLNFTGHLPSELIEKFGTTNIACIQYECDRSNLSRIKFYAVASNNQVIIKCENSPVVNHAFVSTILNRGRLVDLFNLLYTNNIIHEKSRIIEIARYFDSSLSDIILLSPNGVPILYAIFDSRKSIPFFQLGEGLQRVIAILLHMVNLENGVLLIDEIENGLHYSGLTSLWQGIALASREFNCQVIATTHSYECLTAAHLGCREYPEDLTFIRLDREISGEITPTLFSHDMIGVAINNRWDVR